MANDEDREALKKWSLNEVCEMFDWDYEIKLIQAEQYQLRKGNYDNKLQKK